jgi:hypothetical protein
MVRPRTWTAPSRRGFFGSHEIFFAASRSLFSHSNARDFAAIACLRCIVKRPCSRVSIDAGQALAIAVETCASASSNSAEASVAPIKTTTFERVRSLARGVSRGHGLVHIIACWHLPQARERLDSCIGFTVRRSTRSGSATRSKVVSDVVAKPRSRSYSPLSTRRLLHDRSTTLRYSSLSSAQ